MFYKGRQDNQSITAGGKDLILSCGSYILLINLNFEKKANTLVKVVKWLAAGSF